MNEKKVVYITGGNRGIGRGIAEVLLANGFKVAISGRNKEKLEKTITELGEISSDIIGIVSDVRSPNDETKAVESIVNKWGRMDVLIANAGLGIFGAVDQMSHEDWNTVIDTNVTGVFNSVKASVEEIKKTEGYIITMASLAGTNFFPNGSAYIASKFAIVGFSQAIMLDMRPYNVKVSTIMPGSVTSNFNNHTPNDEDAWKIQPQDIGDVVYNLLKMNPRCLPSKIEVRPSQPLIRPGRAPQ